MYDQCPDDPLLLLFKLVKGHSQASYFPLHRGVEGKVSRCEFRGMGRVGKPLPLSHTEEGADMTDLVPGRAK
jgi:hypothetical protein